MRSSTLLLVLALAGCGTESDLTRGARVYGENCASCHGAKLEGQPNWKEKLPDGTWLAPPHDDSGHTWHHSDRWLFYVVEKGIAGPRAESGDQSVTHQFGDKLSDSEIRAVLEYIKAQWSEETRRKRDRLVGKRRSTSQIIVDHFRR